MLSLAYPEKKGSAQILEGDVADLVEKVIGILKDGKNRERLS